MEDYLREAREVLEYAEAVNTLIKIAATGQPETPEGTEEQQRQIELLSESQCEILARLSNVAKKALGSARALVAQPAEGGGA